MGKFISAAGIFAPDAASGHGFAYQVGDGVALLFVQFEALAQGGVGQCLAGPILQHGVLVTGLNALGGFHVAELAWCAEGDAEGVFFWSDTQRWHTEKFNRLYDFLKAGAAFFADVKAAKCRSQCFVA